MTAEHLTIAIAQIAPVWLNRDATLARMLSQIADAARQEAQLITFGEAFLPGYPFWVERSDGARFNHPVQKAFYAHYLDQGVSIEAGHLDPLRQAAADLGIAIVFGCMERAADRGGHSLYCSMVTLDAAGTVRNVHRKMMPTYEERLVWAIGDGHGLRVIPLGRFTVGGLNCWENWMPLSRSALCAQGEDLHIAIWPGGLHNTVDVTRFIALESRSYVISACGLMRPSDIPADLPHREAIADDGAAWFANGGSCVAGPDGAWVIEPAVEREALLIATLDHRRVREERHNFDPAGHYSRPDVTRLVVNRERQGLARFDDDA